MDRSLLWCLLTLVARPVLSAEAPLPTDAQLAQEISLPTLLAIAKAHNPSLREARTRISAATLHQQAARALPDAELRYELERVPLTKPYAVHEAESHMLTFMQGLPPWGVRDAEEHVAQAELQLTQNTAASRELDVLTQVRRAYFEYYRTSHEAQIHIEHVAIANQVVEAARANYQAGRGGQQDVLRVVVELSRLHNEVASIEQQKSSARAALNTLLGRDPTLPLGTPAELSVPEAAPQLEPLLAQLVTWRPDVAFAQGRIARSAALLEAADDARTFPTLMLGITYEYMPQGHDHHGLGAMAWLGLPWLNSRYDAAVAEAEHNLAAERLALDATLANARYQVIDAFERFVAAKRSYSEITAVILPQARQSFEATQGAFANGQASTIDLLDALRSYLQVRLEHGRALVGLESALATLEQTVGVELGKVDESSHP